ncbi:penicillin acylase family protein [Luteimonas sp. MC1825]|uniref:penicillin acylase family protein n=1 Tax=Luteimonas sp. MC1825 TaxID=2761107 RepID=UPI00160CE005|nr:penicillin acylase family protein [Luteimonas sp. MC1825]MBB6599185.1 penicillin acylase family protein [Luteimonas sp. MC1825]QOC89306.1 penicillin acylase family protein [Luteimonas sp. MC1825]
MVRWCLRLAALMLLCVALAALAGWWALRASLPLLDGNAGLSGLAAPVTVTRDALGVATIDAGTEADAMRALGYVHAQERYFEMDLMRRTAAGELAALFGPVALDADRAHRVHRMRARIAANLDAILGDRRAQLDAYVEGVNAGLAALDVRPWPYLLLRTAPEPWRAEDSALVAFAMYFDLQDAGNARELALWKVRPHLPAALHALVTHAGSSWDAPLSGDAIGDATLPGADVLDLRRLPAPDHGGTGPLPDAPEPGSNNFAVAGTLTADGRAIVADDMHLGLRAPGTWFRARLHYADAGAQSGGVDVSGFTLPGLPAVIVGSNRHVAWGFTNSYGDYLDWALETPCGPSPARGCAAVETHRETILVAGADPVALDVRETPWGTVLHELDDGRVLSLRWTAHLPGAVNFGLAGMARARGIDHALVLARDAAMPTQNLVIGDRGGRIAWRLIGPLPQRASGCTPVQPVTEAGSDACPPWAASTRNAPTLASPTVDRLWTANSRVVSGPSLERIGDGGYALGARGAQIRDALRAADRFNERDLLAIQLDDRALFLARWWRLLRERSATSPTPALAVLSAAAAEWEGRADPASTSYRVVRAWRIAVNERIADGLLAPARAALGDDFAMPALPQLEGVAWPLVSQRPAHLLPRRFASWEALFEDAAVAVRDELSAQGPLAARNWGEYNTARICHPLASALPRPARGWLCMPADALPGDTHMPRVQGPAFGASQRMVVSPGREADGFIHMPGGQSGHPLSPFWGAGHDDWVHGRPTPFLPGKAEHALVLAPR